MRPKRRIRKSQRYALRLPWYEYDEVWDYAEQLEANTARDFIRFCQLEAENAALQAKLEIVIDSCEWERDENNDIWMTSCGGTWVFTNDGPKENECHYCMYCGRIIEALEGGDE
jgi:hypothetical protein